MKVRSLLVLTALVSSMLGAIAIYLALTVPNDLNAGALLKEARSRLAEGKTGEAHDKLSQVVQQYPRTDAAAAATVALMKLEEQERQRVQSEIARLRKDHETQAQAIGDLQKKIQTIRTAPPAAAPVAAAAPAPAPAKITITKKPTAKKPTAKKSTKKPTKRPPTKRRRR